MTRAHPARLHILLARDASTAVVIRRGPSRHTAVIGWDRATDRFEVGQWLYGRIYERRCDLSPDGRHLVYFAMNGRWDSRARGAWTAVSKAPYLKALTLLAKGDCWHGGGLFASSRELWVNDGHGHRVLEDDARIQRTAPYPWHESYGGECPGVYYVRLQRDGWTMKYTAPDSAGGTVTMFERRINTHWRLRKLAHATVHHPVGKGCYFDEHQLFNARTEKVIALPNWEWAEIDGGRIVWAEAGRLHVGRVEGEGLGGSKLLFDFNPMTFEKVAAPY
ncbi:MAG TPA: hypothetical protein VJO99_08085 [Burkholderiaceae bacterium]|nr:hypothetical protein [Burkholderiaceae bacterium]